MAACAADLELFLEEGGVDGRVEREERGSEAGREGRGRLGHAALGAGNLCGEAGDEVVHCLAGRQPGDWGQDSVGIAGQEDAGVRVASGPATAKPRGAASFTGSAVMGSQAQG